MTDTSSSYGPGTRDRLLDAVVGRPTEIDVVVASLMSGRHLLLEGPPGTGKSTMLRAVADAADTPFEFVEGNAELTPARFIGHFDPARILDAGYTPEVWIDGPLARAMRDGALLYVEEINRIPEETLNVLVTVMSEGDLTVPRLGRIDAHPGFRLVAAMNPYDVVGTARISGALSDRMCRISMGYQSAREESTIVAARATAPDGRPAGTTALRRRAVETVRATRDHAEIRVGSSVRGAIDLCLLADALAELRRSPVEDDSLGEQAAIAALSGRIQLHDLGGRSPEAIVAELWRATAAGPEDEAGDPSADSDGSDEGEGGGSDGAPPDEPTAGKAPAPAAGANRTPTGS